MHRLAHTVERRKSQIQRVGGKKKRPDILLFLQGPSDNTESWPGEPEFRAGRALTPIRSQGSGAGEKESRAAGRGLPIDPVNCRRKVGPPSVGLRKVQEGEDAHIQSWPRRSGLC